MNYLKKIIQKFKNRINFYRKCLRKIHLKERVNNASPKIKDLIINGFTIFKWEEVFNESFKESKLYKEMKEEAQKLSFESSSTLSIKAKYLAKKYAPEQSIKDGGLLKFCFSNEISSLLYQYFNDSYQVYSLDYWKTKPYKEKKIGSQNWHTDPEDPLMLKIFVYFHSVSDKNGATELIKRTQVGGSECFRKFPYKNITGGYVSDSVIKSYEDKELIKRLDADEASIIFVNTTALHRGGWGSEGRLMANLVFTSLHCDYLPRYITSNISK